MSSSTERLAGETGNIGAPSVESQINKIGIGRFQYLMLFIFGLMVITDGMEMVVISLLYTALHKDWGISQLEEGLLAGVIFLGCLGGNIVGGYLGDQWGRRNTLLLSGVVFLVSATLSAFAPDLITLCLLRTCVGFAVGAKMPVTTAILIEILPTKDRGVYGLVLGGIAFACGEMFVCLAGMAIYSVDHTKDWWRSLLLACVLPDVFAFPLAWRFMPESPSWLITRARHDEVEELLQDMAITNTGSTECLLQGGRIRRVKEEADKQEKWADIFDEIGQLFSPKLRQITIFLMILWAVCCFTYYGHVFIYPIALEQRYHMELENQFFAVFLAGAAEIPGVVAAMFLIDIEGVGRRRTILAFLLAGSLVALCVPFFSDTTQFLAANMLLKTLINTPFCILYIFAAELFPTTHRAVGIAFCSASSRLAGACAPVIAAWAISRSVTLTYQLFSIAMGIGAVATLMFEFETQNARLPEFLDEVCAYVLGVFCIYNTSLLTVPSAYLRPWSALRGK
jgi:putative MFS transporter